MTYCDGHSNHTFGYAQHNCHQIGFIVPLPTGISTYFDVIGQYEVIGKAVFEPVLSIVALRRSSEVDWDSYVDVEHNFLGYELASVEISSLPPS